MEIPDVGEFEEPDPDSDYDYEDYSSKRRKKKTPAKAPRVMIFTVINFSLINQSITRAIVFNV